MRRRWTTWLACWPALASAQAGLTQAGPDPNVRCGAFTVGPCAAAARAPAPPAAPVAPAAARAPSVPPAAQAAPPRAAAEAEVDAFLAQHGKPPREVARALLDPTDENIAAMARRLQRDHAVAAYVAQRMTDLQQSDPTLATAAPSAVPADLPSFTGLRLVLVSQIECARCDRAAQALQRLVAIYPTLDARVVVAGVREPRQLVAEMARSGVTLPTAPADDALLQRTRRAPPFLVIADIRRQREALLVDVEDTERLRVALLEFQRARPARPEAARNEGDEP
jgi:hypothetical protein